MELPPASRTPDDGRGKIAERLLGKGGDFTAYFNSYQDLAQRNNDFHIPIDNLYSTPRLTTESVLLACEVIKRNASETKMGIAELMREAASNSDPKLSHDDQTLATAVQAMLMIDPSAKSWHSDGFVIGDYRPSSWSSGQSLVDFIQQIFPLSLRNETSESARAVAEQRSLRARNLQKRLGARFRLTNNLAEHLLYDERRTCLYIFHHVAYLEAHLELHRETNNPLSLGTAEGLSKGTLPPQLLVETLYSIQAILFPSIDPDSARILDELVEKRGFDPDCTEYEGYKLFLEPPHDFKFIYWGERVAHLHRLLARRPPRNKLERWFHHHSNEGNALGIALLALVISIFVGIVSIVLNGIQIWITVMAWKYPVT